MEKRLYFCKIKTERDKEVPTLKMAVSRSIFVLSYLSIIPVVKYNILSNAYIEQVYLPITERNVTASLEFLKMIEI